uniref:Kinesin-like protein KIF26A/B helical domain-containing protein n=1 Tax=Periophthalmus magnuspinnatus TaxID=409849 RepID=A0A3B3ZD46_9GOBI
MTSLSGSKERSGSSRSRKYAVPDTSPTKSSSYLPETWYRKVYDEGTRSSTRPAPEGAGSMPSSTGTPSPGSGISSPGSFSGSPGTISPGIGTGSPGSLGGSPGFGTGSPASGSGSSPGSERVIWCENCNARLTELKRQALKLLIPGPYSSKDPSFSLLLHDKLQVPNSSRRAWNERDSRCDVCATHLTQLKQEAVRLVLSLDQWDLSPASSPPALIGRSSGGPAFFPSPPVGLNSPGPGNRLGSKPSSLGLSGGERRSASPSLGKAASLQQQQIVVNSSGSNSGNSSNNGSNAVAQAHQLLNRSNGGVTLYPYQISQVLSEASREDGCESRSNTSSPSHTSSSPHTNSPSHTSTSSTTSAAASFFAR